MDVDGRGPGTWAPVYGCCSWQSLGRAQPQDPGCVPTQWQEGWEGAPTRELIPKRQAAMPSPMLSLMPSLMPSSMPSLQGSAAG